MTPSIQIAVDCADPHALARFWAEVLGYEVEDHHELIEQVVAAGYATYDETMLIDGRRAWTIAAACRDPHGTGPRLLFQVVPEPKAAKNRVHLDLHLEEGQRQAMIDRCTALGATTLWEGRHGPQTWVTMQDPQGNEFCLS